MTKEKMFDAPINLILEIVGVYILISAFGFKITFAIVMLILGLI